MPEQSISISQKELTSAPWVIQRAFEHCEKVTKGHYENFPVGSYLIPRDKRHYVYSIYAFARAADDFADESKHSADERMLLLNDWTKKLTQCYEGEVSHPVFIALRETIRHCAIPQELLMDLLTAFKMDVTKNRYENYRELLTYCRYSANPVGRLILHLFGYTDPSLLECSDYICTALQLANHWQDVAIDLEKNRIYLPHDDLTRFGHSEAEIWKRTVDDSFRALMRHEVTVAKGLFLKGWPLCHSVGKDLSLEMRLTWWGGMRILEKIEANGYDVFRRRPVITALDLSLIFLRAITKKKPALPPVSEAP